MMKRLVKLCLVCLMAVAIDIDASAQNYIDCVYLNNGSIIRGAILEQIPGETIKIKTGDGSIFVYQMSEVMKITKEEAPKTSSGTASEPLDTSVGLLSWTYEKNRVVVNGVFSKDLSDIRLKRILGESDYSTFRDAQIKYTQGRTYMKAFYWSTGVLLVSGGLTYYLGAVKDSMWSLAPGFVALTSEITSIIYLSLGLSKTIKPKKVLDSVISNYNSRASLYSFEPVFNVSPILMSTPDILTGQVSFVPGISIGVSF
ncbi:MAG: hypothetical protein J6X25_07035 [Bacteroidales bacterium]|nr:hypothetical protein [Bacteroidales bacterium]